MLSSLKKTSDKSTVPAWHPNFRNFERLPDTKAVRTSFFTNGVALCIALGLLIYTGYREYALRQMNSDTVAMQQAIETNKPVSNQAVQQFKAFQEQERKLMALRDFLAESRMVVSELILKIGSTVPSSVTLKNIDLKPNVIVLRGQISGASDEASGRAVAYIEELRKDPVFSKLFDDISLTSIVRDSGSGNMKIQVDLKFKATAVKPGAQKK